MATKSNKGHDGEFNSKEKKNSDGSIQLDEIDESFLKFIAQEKKRTIFNLIIVIYILIVQVLNLYFILSVRLEPLPPRYPNNSVTQIGTLIFPILEPLPGPPPLPDQLIPTIILAVFAIFIIIQAFHLYKWSNSERAFRSNIDLTFGKDNYLRISNPQTTNNANTTDNANTTKHEQTHNSAWDREDYIPFSEIFYQRIEYIDKSRIVFYIINVIWIIYANWYIKYFIMLIDILSKPYIPFFNDIMQVLNLISQILFGIFIISSWIHYRKFIKIEKKLKQIEGRIAAELDID